LLDFLERVGIAKLRNEDPFDSRV